MIDRTAEFRGLYKRLRIADQRDFYEKRSHEYDRAHRQAIAVRNTLLACAALAGIVGQLLSETGRTWAGLTAAVLAALATVVTAFESLIGFGPLSKLYRDAAINLAEAEVGWGATGSDLAADVEKVESVFRSENGHWGQLAIQNIPAPKPSTPAE
jgi:hypothetical protein